MLELPQFRIGTLPCGRGQNDTLHRFPSSLSTSFSPSSLPSTTLFHSNSIAHHPTPTARSISEEITTENRYRDDEYVPRGESSGSGTHSKPDSAHKPDKDKDKKDKDKEERDEGTYAFVCVCVYVYMLVCLCMNWWVWVVMFVKRRENRSLKFPLFARPETGVSMGAVSAPLFYTHTQPPKTRHTVELETMPSVSFYGEMCIVCMLKMQQLSNSFETAAACQQIKMAMDVFCFAGNCKLCWCWWAILVALARGVTQTIAAYHFPFFTETIKVFDGNCSYRRRIFRAINVPRTCSLEQLLTTALRAFHIARDPNVSLSTF